MCRKIWATKNVNKKNARRAIFVICTGLPTSLDPAGGEHYKIFCKLPEIYLRDYVKLTDLLKLLFKDLFNVLSTYLSFVESESFSHIFIAAINQLILISQQSECTTTTTNYEHSHKKFSWMQLATEFSVCHPTTLDKHKNL